jgi:hypothetical protein
MEPISPRPRIYVSSSGFLWGRQPVTTYDSGCFRSIAWSTANRDLRGSIPTAYAMVGARHEYNHAGRLHDEGVAFHRELSMGEQVPGTEVIYTGRCDFLLPGSVDETKATFSASAKNYILRKGQWKVSHLAQLVGYLWQQEFKKGRIVVGVYEFHPEDIFTGNEYHHIGTRDFQVEIQDDGQIFLDTKPTPYYVQDQLAHVHVAARVVQERKVWPERPFGWQNKWGSPCHFCKFKGLCDKYEAGGVSEADSFTEARDYIQGEIR